MQVDLEKLRINAFKIVVQFDGKPNSLKVEQSYLSSSKEVFKIIDGNVFFEITSDRPLIKLNPNSRKKPTYKAIDSRIEKVKFFESISIAYKEISQSAVRLVTTS